MGSPWLFCYCSQKPLKCFAVTMNEARDQRVNEEMVGSKDYEAKGDR